MVIATFTKRLDGADAHVASGVSASSSTRSAANRTLFTARSVGASPARLAAAETNFPLLCLPGLSLDTNSTFLGVALCTTTTDQCSATWTTIWPPVRHEVTLLESQPSRNWIVIWIWRVTINRMPLQTVCSGQLSSALALLIVETLRTSRWSLPRCSATTCDRTQTKQTTSPLCISDWTCSLFPERDLSEPHAFTETCQIEENFNYERHLFAFLCLYEVLEEKECHLW